MNFKREDYFAPLGYFGTNGSKTRQGLYLISQAAASGKYKSVISGMALPSPTHFHIPALAKHYGLEAINVVGQSRLEKAVKEREMVKCGNYLGAKFLKASCNYNASIQKTAKDYQKEHPDAFYIEYGITLDHKIHSAQEVSDFHMIGAEQVCNIPMETERLIIALGSGNSSTSVLLGIAKYHAMFPNLKNIELVGTGPDHLKYVQERLELIGSFADINTKIFNYKRSDGNSGASEGSIDTTFYNVAGKGGLYNYDMKLHEDFGDVELHGRYESKVLNYIRNYHPEFINEKSLFWVVGSDLKFDALKEVYPEGNTGEPVEVFL